MTLQAAQAIVGFVNELKERHQTYGLTSYLTAKEVAKDMILEAIAKGYAEDNQALADIALWLNHKEE